MGGQMKNKLAAEAQFDGRRWGWQGMIDSLAAA
jgi:hypothetical protein